MDENTNIEQNASAAKQQDTKTKRDLVLERLKTRHPNTEYEDDESIYGAINDDYDAEQKVLQGYKDNEKAMGDWLGSDPEAATFLQAMKAGKSPYAELIRTHGEDAIDYYSDPDNADEIASAQSESCRMLPTARNCRRSMTRICLPAMRYSTSWKRSMARKL